MRAIYIVFSRTQGTHSVLAVYRAHSFSFSSSWVSDHSPCWKVPRSLLFLMLQDGQSTLSKADPVLDM